MQRHIPPLDGYKGLIPETYLMQLSNQVDVTPLPPSIENPGHAYVFRSLRHPNFSATFSNSQKDLTWRFQNIKNKLFADLLT